MIARMLATFLLLGSTAFGGVKVIVELVPDKAGPYVGGESLTVDVWLHSQVEINWRIYLVQFDFTDTDSALALDATFTFDFSSLGDQFNHYLDVHFSELPVPWTANLILCCCPSTRLFLPQEASLHIGSVGLRVPTAPGVYRLDALNSAEADEILGARIRTSPDCCESSPASEVWRAFTGQITGGTFDFVIPPPIPTVSQWGLIVMTTFLLALGSLMIMRRRRGTPNRMRPDATACANRYRSSRGRHHFAFFVTGICTAYFLFAPLPTAIAEPLPIPTETVVVSFDSGTVSANGGGTEPVVVYSEIVGVECGVWIRLHFAGCQLSGSPGSGDESFLRITSLQDGAVQIMNSLALNQWADTSAYFNGNEVLVELLAYPGTGDNSVVIDEIAAGLEPDPPAAPTIGICGFDDRLPSNDPRTGRLRYRGGVGNCQSLGCTGFLFDNRGNALLTAGHCCDGISFVGCSFTPIVEFTDQANGTLQVASPDDQYLIDRCSLQSENAGQGKDWCYFRVFDNTDTGLSPLVAQGASYRLLQGTVPGPSGETLRVTGYGADSNEPQRSGTQQSDIGPYDDRLGTKVFFVVDIEGGSSGSGIVRECTPHVYGIATHAGCGNPAFLNNVGTAIHRQALQDAIANPVSTCADCNNNAIDDACDVDCGASGGPCDVPGCGLSGDCNANNVPDECELVDCNNNGTLDVCDVFAGTSLDCNLNLVPDECEPDQDCNTNGTPDICDIGAGSSDDCNCNSVPDECETDCNANGEPDDCDLAGEISPDCNANAVPDECDIASGTSTDCDGNGIPDECEIVDCNANGVHDPCDITGGTSQDCTGNGIPDECEPDCNGNGTADSCDIAADPSLDQDGNTIPDSCQQILSVPGQYPTIQSAIDAAAPGDTVLIASNPNPYQGVDNKDLDFGGKILTVRCEKVGQCVIDCQNDGRGFYFHLGETGTSVVDGLKIINGRPCEGGNSGAGMLISGSSPTIRNCIFTGNDTGSSGLGGAISIGGASPTIINCLIFDNRGSKGGGGISCSDCTATITNCTITDNNTIGSGFPGGGISIFRDSHPQVTNSIVWGNIVGISTPDQITISGPQAELTVSYSALGPGSGIQLLQGAQVHFGNGIIQNVDPLFENSSADDYHLTLSSPCIDAGDPAFDGSGRVDIDGEPRVFNGLVEMGADEFNDCNGNDIQDYKDIDDCAGDPACADCNENVIPDECDIASGSSADCNTNGVPDECEPPEPVGACCMGDGSCQELPEACCAGAGGSFLGAGTVCNTQVGACCIPPLPGFPFGKCKQRTECSCEQVGGAFYPFANCATFNCPTELGPQPGG